MDVFCVNIQIMPRQQKLDDQCPTSAASLGLRKIPFEEKGFVLLWRLSIGLIGSLRTSIT